jgi:hypothetical protein
MAEKKKKKKKKENDSQTKEGRKKRKKEGKGYAHRGKGEELREEGERKNGRVSSSSGEGGRERQCMVHSQDRTQMVCCV